MGENLYKNLSKYMKTDPQNPSKIDEIGDVKSGRPAGRPKSQRRRALRPSPASPGHCPLGSDVALPGRQRSRSGRPGSSQIRTKSKKKKMRKSMPKK